jgi:hypothetical protein
MSDKPAVLLSEDLVSLLGEKAICKASYEELTGTKYPWEIDHNKIQKIRKKIEHIEVSIRAANPSVDITCIVAGEGAFWLNSEGLAEFTDKMKNKKKSGDNSSSKKSEPMPVWKLTSGEIFNSHISNIRRLVLCVCHDMVLLEHLKNSFGENHRFIKREFERYERFVRILTDDMKEQGSNLTFALSEDIIMMERAEITMKMLDNKIISKDQLGYSEQELMRVLKVLDQRCKSDIPTYRKRLQSIYNQMQQALREGETTQLTRASRWEFAFGLLETAPVGYRGQMEAAELERKEMQTVVSSREKELGESELGKASLLAAQEAERGKLLEKPEPTEEKPETPPEEPIEEAAPKKRKSARSRMAFTSRRR